MLSVPAGQENCVRFLVLLRLWKRVVWFSQFEKQSFMNMLQIDSND